MKSTGLIIASALCIAAYSTTSTSAFAPSSLPNTQRVASAKKSSSSARWLAKGFGSKPAPKKPESDGARKRQQEASQYDEIAGKGGQEYRVFVRQFGSDDQSWLPCGAVAVPRGAQVSDAIFVNQEALKQAIVRTYPKLKGFEEEFEFGFNLKVYPDDPVEVATKNAPRSQGLSVGNWISTLLSPVDASAVRPPPIKE